MMRAVFCRAFTRSIAQSNASATFRNHVVTRQFSKYEIDIQDASKHLSLPPSVESPPQKAQPTLSPSQKRSVEEITEQLIIAEHKSQVELQNALALLLECINTAQAILTNNETTSSEEMIATADYLWILMNDEGIDVSVAKIQELQSRLDQPFVVHDGELSRAISAVNKLHRIFLNTIDSCIPQVSTSVHTDNKDYSLSEDSSYDKERYSTQTVARAIQLSQRAEDLGMPLHRPLYRRLAISVVLTSLPVLDCKEYVAIDDAERKEGMTPQITKMLIDLCSRARSALKIPSPIFTIESDPLGTFTEEILTMPLLLLLKHKEWEEAMVLLDGWREHLGRSEKIVLLDLLGEEATLEALEIAKDWVVEDEFGGDAQACRHILELTNLLQDSLELILDERKNTLETLSSILPNIIYQSSPVRTELDTDASDSEFEEDVGDEDEDWDQSNDNERQVDRMEYIAAEDEHQIIPGMSNKDARLRIYLRNRSDWSIPDIVSQLENWNKGNNLSFSPSFEAYLGHQMTEEDEEYFD